MAIRAVVVEDDPRYRASLETLLRHAPGFAFVASFGSPALALGALDVAPGGGAAPWDLAVMDLELPGMSGVEATRRLKARFPDVKVVVLTVFEEPRTVLEAICAGADGYLLKRTAPEELLEQLEQVMRGGAPLTAGVARTVLDLVRHSSGERAAAHAAPSRIDLTEREQEVLRLLVRGMAYKEIAQQLAISLETVRSHVKSVYRKLHVHSVGEAVSRAIHQRVV